ncbi:MAG: hypothetical protein ACFWTQ_10250 [Lactococcus sp.]|jgi:hypothetical protein
MLKNIIPSISKYGSIVFIAGILTGVFAVIIYMLLVKK